MTSLVDRRLRGDVITTYNIMTKKDKVEQWVFFGLPGDGTGPRTMQAASEHRQSSPS